MKNIEEKRKLYNGFIIKDLRDLVLNRYKKFENKSAFEYRKDRNSEIIKITYKQFIDDIKSLGTSLLKLGLRKKRVAIISANRYEWCVSYLAITTSDMVAVPLDKLLPENEIENLINRSEAETIIFDIKYLKILKKLKDSEKINVKNFICMDLNQNEDDILSYSKLLIEGSKEIKSGNNIYDKIEINKNEVSVMIFTSGTTSDSKAVMLSQANLCAEIHSLSCMAKVTEEDRFLSFLPLNHTYESSCTFLYGTSCGITVVFTDGIKYIANNFKEFEITGFVCVPAVLEIMHKKIMIEIKNQNKEKQIKFARIFSNILLKAHIDIRRKIFKPILDNLGGKLRMLITGGASISKEANKAFLDFGINILQGYGLTETSAVIAGENDKYKKIGSVGFALPDIEIKIDNPDIKGIGEIIVKSPTTMLGYYKNEEITKSVLKNGWFYTGDLGYIDKKGYLFLTGRKKDMIVLKNGKKVFPEEIETLINKLSFVSESMVFAIADKNNDNKIYAKIVYDETEMKKLFPNAKKSDYKNLIMNHIKNLNHSMPTYKYIKDIIITNKELIKTTTQKIKRFEEIKLISNEINI